MGGKTLFEKIWDLHVVEQIENGPSVLYIDRHYLHEVTSPVAFEGLKKRGIKVFRPERTFATVDHNVPTLNQHLPIKDPLSRSQVEKLEENCKEHGITFFGLGNPSQGIVHVIGPEKGLTLPGMTIVCGDSHTATHGAFGSIAFGIGTSEVEMVLASQCLLQVKPKKMRMILNGELSKGVTSKDVILYIISKISASGGTGYFIEYTGTAIEKMSMEARMTICNMSIECGSRGGMIKPDEITFEYLKGREYSPKGKDWDEAIEFWKTLYTDNDAIFDKEYTFNVSEIAPMITYGTNPGMGIPIDGVIPDGKNLSEQEKITFFKALEYMDLEPGTKLLGKPIDYVFLGSCTNGRIEDFRLFASLVKGRKKAKNVIAWLVPGSKQVEKQIYEEGIADILIEAGFEIRQPGCSACLAMNEDKIPEGKYAVSTTNRNFEGRQGPGSRTFLASPLTAAAAAITGKITDPREFMLNF